MDLTEEEEEVPFAEELGFLTVDYLSDLMVTSEEGLALVFNSQLELFRSFLYQQSDLDLKAAFRERMVACILVHPLAKQIKVLDLSRVECGDGFVTEFVSQAKQYPDLMTNVEVFKVSSDRLTGKGLVALSELLECHQWPYLRELYVDNNNGNRPYHVTVEQVFARILADPSKNKNLVKLSLDCRHKAYRENIQKRLFQNLDSSTRQLRLVQTFESEEEEVPLFSNDEPAADCYYDEEDLEMGQYPSSQKAAGTITVPSGNKNEAVAPQRTLPSSALEACFRFVANRCIVCCTKRFLRRSSPGHGKTT